MSGVPSPSHRTATVADVMQLLGEKEGELVLLSPTQSIESAMEILNESQILSAPMVSGSGRFVGIVDVHDMLDLAVEAYKKGDHSGQWASILQSSLDKCSRNKSRDISFLAKGPGTSKSVAEVVTGKFLGGNVHRLAVSDCDGHPLAIFSQSDVVRYLSMQPSQIGPKASLTLQELWVGQQTPITLPHTASAIDGLVLMHDQNVRVLPIVSAEGKLVAQLSTTSLRGLCTKDLPLLNKPVLEFLSNTPARARRAPTPLKLKPDITLQQCILELSNAYAHECFVVDAEDRPIAVVTLTDVLRFIWG